MPTVVEMLGLDADQRVKISRKLMQRHLQSTADFEDLTSFMLNDAMQSRMLSIADLINPTPEKLTTEVMQPELAAWARINAGNTIDRAVKRTSQTVNELEEIEALYKAYPEITDKALGKDWLENFKEGMKDVGKGTWSALSFVLGNLDRARGALATYADTIAKGGSGEDAVSQAARVFKGGRNGWKWRPEIHGALGKEVLVSMGADDVLGTKIFGFALDMLMDPLVLLGSGVARNSINVGVGQYLNPSGRKVYGEFLDSAMKKFGRNYADLGSADIYKATNEAKVNMRKLLNTNREVALNLLDVGGMKLAGATLPGTATVVKKVLDSKGKRTYQYVKRSLWGHSGVAIDKGLRALESWGRSGGIESQSLLHRAAVLFPSEIRRAGNAMGDIIHRVNPAAGTEYRNFKQFEYYDRIAYEENIVLQDMDRIFDGFGAQELEQMTLALDRRTVHKLSEKAQRAVKDYQKLTDDVIIDEMNRGIFKPEWARNRPDELPMFEQWVRARREMPIDRANALLSSESIAKRFNKTYHDNYVTHIYRDRWRREQFGMKRTQSAPPSIIMPFSETRTYDTLDEAIRGGMVPELNLRKLASVRLAYGRKQIATADFLEGVAKEFGYNRSAFYSAKASISVRNSKLNTLPTAPKETWEELLDARLVNGKYARSISDQILLAEQVAREPRVPIAVISRFDDAAKARFIEEKLRIAPMGAARSFWRAYVETPTKKGIYDGMKVAPGKTFEEAIAKVRDLNDPFYKQWEIVPIKGKADPRSLQEIIVPAPIAKDLSRMQIKQFSPELQDVLRIYDKLNYFWKRSVTVPWPAFHTRNKLTNVVNTMADVGLVAMIKNRPAMYGILWGGKGTLKTELGDVKYSFDAVREMMLRHGVIRHAYRRTDVLETIKDLAERQAKTAGGLRVPLPGGKDRLGGIHSIPVPFAGAHPLSRIAQAGQDVASTIENGDRAMIFVSSLVRGMSPQQAARRVNKFLFDYDDLSGVESAVMRRLIPFWTWARKSMALQTKITLQRPVHQNRLGNVIANLSKEEPDGTRDMVEKQLLPEFLRDELGIRTKVGEQFSEWIMNVDLPMKDLNKFWSHSMNNTIMKEWVGQMMPLMQDVAEVFLGKDFYTGKDTIGIDNTMKIHNIIAAAPEEIKTFLNVHETHYKDRKIYHVDAQKWKILAATMAFTGMQRVYSTSAFMADDDTKMSHRLFRLFTGGRVRRTFPAAEVAKAQERVLREAEPQISNALRTLINEVGLYTYLNGGKRNALVSTENKELDKLVKRADYATEGNAEDLSKIYDFGEY